MKRMTLGLIIVGMGLCISWKRSDETAFCEKNKRGCKLKEGDCKEIYEQCLIDAARTDEDSFVSHLSNEATAIYYKFSPEEKKQAMDYADNNQMPPEEAVAKVIYSIPE